MKAVEGGVCAPKGFKASGFAAGIKEGSEDKDCALIVSEEPCVVAGMFTTNVMKSPPVHWNQEVCEGGRARAVFLNSGNAGLTGFGCDEIKFGLAIINLPAGYCWCTE